MNTRTSSCRLEGMTGRTAGCVAVIWCSMSSAWAQSASPVDGGAAPGQPLAYLKECLLHAEQTIDDYTCTMRRQEFIGGRLTPEQVIDVMFREKPWSVRMEWKEGKIGCSRVLYVADRWVEDGHAMAAVEPAGSVARWFVSYVMRPIDGEEARRNSRRPITSFGFRNTLNSLIGRCGAGMPEAVRFTGHGRVDGRPTRVFEINLDAAGTVNENGEHFIIAEIDEALRLPVRCRTFSDTGGRMLLGRYEFTKIRLNVGLPDRTFTLAGMGLGK